MSEATGSMQRAAPQHDPLSHLSEPLLVPLSARRYNRQFASLYDYRLRRLKHPKGRLLRMATERWGEGATKAAAAGGSSPAASSVRAGYVKRILDVKQGAICYVIGTIYCSMHLKPDVLEDLTREVSRRAVLGQIGSAYSHERSVAIPTPTAS